MTSDLYVAIYRGLQDHGLNPPSAVLTSKKTAIIHLQNDNDLEKWAAIFDINPSRPKIYHGVWHGLEIYLVPTGKDDFERPSGPLPGPRTPIKYAEIHERRASGATRVMPMF